MKIELQAGDTIVIPDGCIAHIDDSKITIKENSQFKDGDILISDFLGPYKLKIIMIYNGTRSYDGGYNCYVFRNHNGKIKINDDACDCDYVVRLATEEEKQELFDYMMNVGLRWNAEEKRVENIRWRAGIGEEYFSFDIALRVQQFVEDNDTCDNAFYDALNYFRTKEQTEEAARRVKKTLRKYHEELGY